MAISPATRTDVGKRRSRNEDVVATDPSIGLYAVFDGMGGEAAGDVAAKIAADEVVLCVRNGMSSLTGERRRPGEDRVTLVREAICAASRRVHAAAAAIRSRRGMGTTVVAALISPDGSTVIAHVGDSRAYLARSGRLIRLTDDHTIVGQLIKDGKITDEEARRNHWRHMLLCSIGQKPVPDEIGIRHVELEGGDRLMLCSDGVHGEIRDPQIAEILARRGTADEAAGELLQAALDAGGRDNASVVVLDIVEMRRR